MDVGSSLLCCVSPHGCGAPHLDPNTSPCFCVTAPAASGSRCLEASLPGHLLGRFCSAASLPAFPHPGNTVSLMPAHPMGCTKVENSHLSSLQICVPHAVPALVSWRALSGAPWLPDAAHHVMSTLTPHSPGAPSESRGSCLLPQPTQAHRVLVPAGSLLLVASSCPAGINSDMASSLEPPPAPRSSLWIISWDF